jgi:hypothetical protein
LGNHRHHPRRIMEKGTHAVRTGVTSGGQGNHNNGAVLVEVEVVQMDRHAANAEPLTNHGVLRIVVPGHREIGVMTGAVERVAVALAAAIARIVTVSMAGEVVMIAARAADRNLSKRRLQWWGSPCRWSPKQKRPRPWPQ